MDRPPCGGVIAWMSAKTLWRHARRSAGVAIGARLTTRLLHQGPPPRPRDRLRRPPPRHERVGTALFVIVAPRVQQLRPQPQLVGYRANLLARQDPANGSLLERSAEDPESSSGHRPSPGGLSLISLSHSRGAPHCWYS